MGFKSLSVTQNYDQLIQKINSVIILTELMMYEINHIWTQEFNEVQTPLKSWLFFRLLYAIA